MTYKGEKGVQEQMLLLAKEVAMVTTVELELSHHISMCVNAMSAFWQEVQAVTVVLAELVVLAALAVRGQTAGV